MHRSVRDSMRKLMFPWCGVAVALSTAAAACASSTIRSAASSPVPIERSERVETDDAALFLQVRGEDRRAPVLVWLHGGPGAPERLLFRYFNSALERDFVVAYWDQRGAGRSFDSEDDPARLTIEQHLADLDAIVEHLRSTLGRNEVVLIGHSWGAALGLLYIQDRPEKVRAFLGVAPLISLRRSEEARYAFVLDEATRRGDDDVLKRLREIGAPPQETAAEALAMESLADRYGAVFHRKPHRMWVLLRGMLRGLVNPFRLPHFFRANRISLEAMNDELLALDLARTVSRVEVPVVFFLGRHDRHVDARIAASYLETLDAPAKQVVWFEQSAHNPPFEQPEWFNAAVVSALESLGIGRGQDRTTEPG